MPGSVLVVIIGGGAAARHSGHRLNQLRWFILFMAASAVVTVYILIIPRYACPDQSVDPDQS